MEYRVAPSASTGTTPFVAVLAACVRSRTGSIRDAACAAVGEVLELAGVPAADAAALRTGVFGASAPPYWSGLEHIAVSEAHGLSGTTVMVSQGRCGSAVALHLAATAVRAHDVDLALVVGPADDDVGAVLIGLEATAARRGWLVRSRLLSSAVGPLGQGHQPPAEVAAARAGAEPERQRFGTTLRDIVDAARAHQGGDGRITGHGISGRTVAAHVLLGPPAAHQGGRPAMPLVEPSGATRSALRVPNLPRGRADEVRAWRARWVPWVAPHPVTDPVHLVGPQAPAGRLADALSAAGREVTWSRSAPSDTDGTVVHFPESWTDIASLAAAVDRQRTASRVVFVCSEPKAVGAARWVAADLPHLFGGLIHADGAEAQLAGAVSAVAGAELRVVGGQIQMRQVRAAAPAPPAQPRDGLWVLGGRLDVPLLELASDCARGGRSPLVLCATGTPEPVALHRALQLRRSGTPCVVVRDRDLVAHIGRRQVAGVVVRIAEPSIRHGHLRGSYDEACVDRAVATAQHYRELAGDHPLWIWTEGRALDPDPGTGVRAVVGAALDSWATTCAAPTTVVHSDCTSIGAWLGRLPVGGIHGLWRGE